MLEQFRFWRLGSRLSGVLGLIGAATISMSQTNFGMPKILPFPNGARAAVSLQFDDSMTTQLANALPLLKAHGIRATFFVNTESWQYKQHRHAWEVEVLNAGHDLGNHTAHHSGAKNEKELAKEIGDCSDALAKVYAQTPRLTSFATPGGVPWDFTPGQLDPIFKKYHLVLATNRNFFEDGKTDPTTFVQRAMDSGIASNVSMHGVGGEWLSTGIPTLTKLLDFLSAHKSEVWVAPEIEIYKYGQEREAASEPTLTPAEDGFTLAVNCDPAKLAFRDQPVVSLYDQPVTVEVSVPSDWAEADVVQGSSHTHITVVKRNGAHYALCPVRPNAGPSKVSKSST